MHTFFAVIALSAVIQSEGLVSSRAGFGYKVEIKASNFEAVNSGVYPIVYTPIRGSLDTEHGTLALEGFSLVIPASTHEVTDEFPILYRAIPPTPPTCDANGCTGGDAGIPARIEQHEFTVAHQFSEYRHTQPPITGIVTSWGVDKATVDFNLLRLPLANEVYVVTGPHGQTRREAQFSELHPIKGEISLVRDDSGVVIDWSFITTPLQFDHGMGPTYPLGSFENNSIFVTPVPEPSSGLLAAMASVYTLYRSRRR